MCTYALYTYTYCHCAAYKVRIPCTTAIQKKVNCPMYPQPKGYKEIELDGMCAFCRECEAEGDVRLCWFRIWKKRRRRRVGGMLVSLVKGGGCECEGSSEQRGVIDSIQSLILCYWTWEYSSASCLLPSPSIKKYLYLLPSITFSLKKLYLVLHHNTVPSKPPNNKSQQKKTAKKGG